MVRITLGKPSLTRTFALLSLVTIAVITAGQISVQWVLLREDLLERERTSTANTIRAAAYAVLDPENFVDWQSPTARERFERFFRRALLNPQILRVKVFNSEMRVVWSDESRLLGTRFPENTGLMQALQGQTVAELHTATKPENLFEKDFPNAIELYIPLAFSSGQTPGTASVTGVVEVYKNPAGALANISRGRLMIIATSLAGAVVLYATLFGVVLRASRQLRDQHDDLERQTTALSLANQELRTTQDRLRTSERLATLGEVSAMVAHGIRNPLANIRASAQVALASPDPTSPFEKPLTIIISEVDRLDHWLRVLLDVVRPLELRLDPVDLKALVEDLLSLLAKRCVEKDIEVRRQFAVDLPRLMADKVQLEQALVSVLENAIDASPREGPVVLQAECAENEGQAAILMKIQDTGEGIPEEQLGRVFEPFFTTKSKGTGLGLAIAKKIVEAHGGSIEIKSEPGTGTTVSIMLLVREPAGELA